MQAAIKRVGRLSRNIAIVEVREVRGGLKGSYPGGYTNSNVTLHKHIQRGDRNILLLKIWRVNPSSERS